MNKKEVESLVREALPFGESTEAELRNLEFAPMGGNRYKVRFTMLMSEDSGVARFAIIAITDDGKKQCELHDYQEVFRIRGENFVPPSTEIFWKRMK